MNSQDIEFEKFLDKNKGLIYHLIKTKYSSNIFTFEELESWGMFVMWKCWKAFDETRGVKFSTLFGIAFDNYVKCEGRNRQNREKREPKMIYLDADYSCGDNDVVFKEMIGDIIDIEEDVVSLMCFKEKVDKLTPKEKLIVEMIIKGESQKHIGEIVGHTQAHTSRMIKKIKEKLRGEL